MVKYLIHDERPSHHNDEEIPHWMCSRVEVPQFERYAMSEAEYDERFHFAPARCGCAGKSRWRDFGTNHTTTDYGIMRQVAEYTYWSVSSKEILGTVIGDITEKDHDACIRITYRDTINNEDYFDVYIDVNTD